MAVKASNARKLRRNGFMFDGRDPVALTYIDAHCFYNATVMFSNSIVSVVAINDGRIVKTPADVKGCNGGAPLAATPPR